MSEEYGFRNRHERQHEPAAPTGIEPVAWMAWDDAHSRNVFATGEVEKARTIGYNWTPLYSAATVKQLVQERDANTAYFEAYHQLRVAVNAAYPQDPYQLAEDVPALMQQQLAAMTQERDELVAIIKEKKK